MLRRADLLAAISHATDLLIGQPVEFALKSCTLAMRLAGATDADVETRRQTFHHALLRYIGCNAETDALAALLGDEIELRRTLAPLDAAAPPELVPVLLRAVYQAQSGKPLASMLWGMVSGLARSKSATVEGFNAHCETAERLARRLGFDDAVVRNLGQFSERWDGKGMPNGLRGDAIAPAVRIVTLAQDAIVLVEAHGAEAAASTVRKRRGTLYEPALADVFVAKASELLSDLAAHATWDAVLALEPEPHVELGDAELDEACLALADFADIKSPYTFGHSRAVAELAVRAAKVAGLTAEEQTTLRRAALLHDLGQVAISSGVFAQPRQLGDTERERIRLHPYYAERILARPPALARLGELVARHHERQDGSGYHRGVRGEGLTPLARILATAEVYRALVEDRPHRPAFSPEQAATTLKREARDGHLDANAVAWVLEAAGHRVAQVRRELPAGLTARELQVLRLLAGGKTTKQIGSALGVSPKTADNHIQNLYAKIGVRTRAGATLFAIERGLVGS